MSFGLEVFDNAGLKIVHNSSRLLRVAGEAIFNFPANVFSATVIFPGATVGGVCLLFAHDSMTGEKSWGNVYSTVAYCSAPNTLVATRTAVPPGYGGAEAGWTAFTVYFL